MLQKKKNKQNKTRLFPLTNKEGSLYQVYTATAGRK